MSQPEFRPDDAVFVHCGLARHADRRDADVWNVGELLDGEGELPPCCHFLGEELERFGCVGDGGLVVAPLEVDIVFAVTDVVVDRFDAALAALGKSRQDVWP